jgi:hypothetical protein
LSRRRVLKRRNWIKALKRYSRSNKNPQLRRATTRRTEKKKTTRWRQGFNLGLIGRNLSTLGTWVLETQRRSLSTSERAAQAEIQTNW